MKTDKYRMTMIIRKFNGNQKRFLISQIMGNIYNVLVSSALTTGFLLYMGIPIYWIGLLLSLPMLANVVQVLIDHIWNYFLQTGHLIARLVLIARLLILSIILIPLILPATNRSAHSLFMKILLVAIIWFPAYIMATGSGIRLNCWTVSTFPTDYISTLLAYRDRIVVGISALLSFGLGYYLDALSRIKDEFIGYFIVFFVAMIISLTDYLVLKEVKDQNQIKHRVVKPFVKCVGDIRRDQKFLQFEFYIFWLNFSINVANPYFNAYMIDYLNLKYLSIMSLNMLFAVTQISVAGLWGKLGRDVSWESILKTVSILLGIQFLVWAFVTRRSKWLLLLIFLSSGMITTGFSAAQFMLPYHYVNLENTLIYMSAHTATVALGGFIGSLLGAAIIHVLDMAEFQFLNFAFTSMQMNMIISGILILLTTLYGKKYVLG